MTLRQFYRTSDLTQASKTAIFCGLQGYSEFEARNRVKRVCKMQNGDNPRFSEKPAGERAMNNGPFLPAFTATIPQAISPYRFGRAV